MTDIDQARNGAAGRAVTGALGQAVAVIGGGPSGLMAASVLAEGGASVTVYEAMSMIGRKFLVAGHGGLNLTNAEPVATFLSRYGDHAGRFASCLARFGPGDVRRWAQGLGIETFVGSGGRVFPQGLKASPLLRAWRARLLAQGVRFETGHRWIGFADGTGTLRFATARGEISVHAAVTVLALGGASWPRTGSDGTWTRILADQGVLIIPWAASNCGFDHDWSGFFLGKHEGRPVKNVVLRHGGQSVRGDFVISAYGIEGGAVYPLTPSLRAALALGSLPVVTLDCKPDLKHDQIVEQLSRPRSGRTLATTLRQRLHLSATEVGLLREIGGLGDPGAEVLAGRIKGLPITLRGCRPIAEAISSAGGVSLDEVDDQWMLARLPGVFIGGEMLDWEAPTGGYLLQGALSTGFSAGQGALAWLGRST